MTHNVRPLRMHFHHSYESVIIIRLTQATTGAVGATATSATKTMLTRGKNREKDGKNYFQWILYNICAHYKYITIIKSSPLICAAWAHQENANIFFILILSQAGVTKHIFIYIIIINDNNDNSENFIHLYFIHIIRWHRTRTSIVEAKKMKYSISVHISSYYYIYS